MLYNVLIVDLKEEKVIEYRDFETFRVLALEQGEKWGRLQILSCTESRVKA